MYREPAEMPKEDLKKKKNLDFKGTLKQRLFGYPKGGFVFKDTRYQFRYIVRGRHDHTFLWYTTSGNYVMYHELLFKAFAKGKTVPELKVVVEGLPELTEESRNKIIKNIDYIYTWIFPPAKVVNL